METKEHLSLKQQIEDAWDLDLLLTTEPKDEYEQVPIHSEAKVLVSRTIRHCLNNGLVPNCAIDGEGFTSSEITVINELDILDLIRNLEEIEEREAS